MLDHRARLLHAAVGFALVPPTEPELRLAPLVLKDGASAYEGGATRRWLKVKQKDWTIEKDRWRRRISE